MATTNGLKTNDSLLATTSNNTRDDRFKRILRQQLGANGISLLSVCSFLMVLAVLLILLASVGYNATMRSRLPVFSLLPGPALVSTTTTASANSIV